MSPWSRVIPPMDQKPVARVGVKSLKKDLNPNPNPLNFFKSNFFEKGIKSLLKNMLE